MALLFHDKELKELMEDFYVLTKIRIALYDEDCNLLISYPVINDTFCAHMRKNPDFLKKCLKSDVSALKKCRDSKEVYIYKCHAGLTEASVPIIENDKVIGYMMFGQVLGSKDKSEITASVEAVLGVNNIPDEIEEKIKKIKYRSNRRIHAAAKILDSITEYVRLKGLVELSKKGIIESIESFINEHINEPLPVERLCREFCISRTKLYKLMSEYYSGGISSFIRHRRLEKAKQLIKNTDMSIAEIAYAVGFSDYNYFLRCFKNEYKISTKKFRKFIQDNS